MATLDKMLGTSEEGTSRVDGRARPVESRVSADSTCWLSRP